MPDDTAVSTPTFQDLMKVARAIAEGGPVPKKADVVAFMQALVDAEPIPAADLVGMPPVMPESSAAIAQATAHKLVDLVEPEYADDPAPIQVTVMSDGQVHLPLSACRYYTRREAAALSRALVRRPGS